MRLGGRAAFAVVSLLALTGRAAAQDQFEIQVYDSETVPPGAAGVETHVNWNAIGTTRRAPTGELATDRVTHLTFEPHLGLAWWCEVGMYLQTAVRPEGIFDYAGVKLRWKARLRKRWHERIGLALNVEWSAVPKSYESTGMAFELRPVADLRYQRLYASLNPILGVDTAGESAGWPRLEPAATVTVRVAGPVELGVEYYGAYGSLNRLASADGQVHRLFGVVALTQPRWALQLGGGYGFAAGERVILKAIVSVDLTRGD